MRYSAGILDLSKGELRQLDEKTRKLLTMYGAFRKRRSVNSLYGSGRKMVEVWSALKSVLEYVSKSEK